MAHDVKRANFHSGNKEECMGFMAWVAIGLMLIGYITVATVVTSAAIKILD